MMQDPGATAGPGTPGASPYPPRPLPVAGNHCRGTWAARWASKHHLCCPSWLALLNLTELNPTELLDCLLTAHDPRYRAGCPLIWDVASLERQR